MSYRQDYLGECPPAILVEQFHTAADTLDGRLTEKQPQPETLLALGGNKGSTQLFSDMQWYSRPVISNAQAQPLGIPLQGHRNIVGTRIGGVIQQIEYRLAQLGAGTHHGHLAHG